MRQAVARVSRRSERQPLHPARDRALLRHLRARPAGAAPRQQTAQPDLRGDQVGEPVDGHRFAFRRRAQGGPYDPGLDEPGVGEQRGLEEVEQVVDGRTQTRADGDGRGDVGVGAPAARRSSRMPAPARTERRIVARAPGWTRSVSGSARQARTTWLSRKGAWSRWLRTSAACSKTRWSAACRASAARARRSPGRSTVVPGRAAASWRRTDTSASASPVSQRAAGPGRHHARAASDAASAPPCSSKLRSSSRAATSSTPCR